MMDQPQQPPTIGERLAVIETKLDGIAEKLTKADDNALAIATLKAEMRIIKWVGSGVGLAS